MNPSPPGGWSPRPPKPDPSPWTATPPGATDPASREWQSPADPISTRGATWSLILGIVAFAVSLVSMTTGTYLDLRVSNNSGLYGYFILISLVGAVVGVIGLILALVFRAQLRRRGSAEARGRALGGLIMGILAIASPLMGFLLGVAGAVAAGQ